MIVRVHINICMVLDSYGVVAAWNLEWRLKTIKMNGTIIINNYNT